MTLIQIGAILQLLLAFGVPQPTVDTVQAILLNTAQPSPIEETAPVGVGAPADVTHVTCTDEPQIRLWPVDRVQVDRNLYRNSIAQAWLYTSCEGQSWFLGDHQMQLNGKPTSGQYKGLNSYVVKDLVVPDAYTLTFSSPDTAISITTSGSI